MTRAARLARAACLTAALLLAGCAPAVHRSAREQIARVPGRDLRVVLHSGREVVLLSPYVEGDSVYGGWTSGLAGDVRVAVALADVARVHAGARPYAERPSAQVTHAWIAAGVVAALLIASGLLSLAYLP